MTFAWQARLTGRAPRTAGAARAALAAAGGALQPRAAATAGARYVALAAASGERPRFAPRASPLQAGRREDARFRVLAGAAVGVAAGLLSAQRRRHGGAAAVGATGLARCDDAASVVVVDKPVSHRHRSYEYLTLPNGMQVILASDSACDKAAAALCVGVGRLHEPKDMPGLAHFCEHMLFLGTEGFPDEADYKRYLKGHGGHCNAATGDSTTCYAFDVVPDHLEGALDRFSQFFIAPLFTPSATERELNAVDSEHSMRITDDGRRSYATLLLDANPAHPLHWGSGNLQSLRDAPRARGTDPHTEVVKFYREHYTAEDMTLAVLGKQSLQELRIMVEARFAPVRTTGRRALRGDDHGGDQPPILPERFAGLVLRSPSKDRRTIALSWQLPSWQVPKWASKPGAYASHLIGHEGEGSLLSALKASGYATAISAGVDDFGSFSQFEVSINLTKEGFEHIQEVGELVFTYIRLVRATPVQTWVLDEMQKLREVRFRFADDRQPYDLVNALARNLQIYPPAEVLAASVKLAAPDAAASAELLERLTVSGLRVELAAKELKERCRDVDPWYSGQYARLPLEDSWRAAWAKALGEEHAAPAKPSLADAEAAAASRGMRLPRPNPFVPEDLELRSASNKQGPHPQELPQEVVQSPGLAKVFHRQDVRWGQPKTVAAFRFHSPAAAADPASYLRCKMWCSAVMEELNEYAYDASSAGLSYHLGVAPGGMEMSVAGFSDKLHSLLEVVAKKMRESGSVRPETFAIVRDRYTRALKNTAFKQRPCDFAGRKSRELQGYLAFTAEDQLKELEKLRLEDLTGENERLLGESHVEMYVLGNAAPEDVATIARSVASQLAVPVEPKVLAFRAEAELPPGRTVWHLDGTDAEERNNNVRLEIQLPVNIESAAHTSLFVRVLSPKFFEELRTKQQLGYIVQMSSTEHEGFISIVCTVQTEYPPDYVRARIDEFFDERIKWLEESLDETEFSRQRAGLVANLKQKPKNVVEAFNRHWGEIGRQRYDFGRRRRKREAIEAADLAAFLAFVRSSIAEAPRLYTQVHSISRSPEKEPSENAQLPREPDRVWRGLDDARRFRESARWVPLNAEAPPRSRL